MLQRYNKNELKSIDPEKKGVLRVKQKKDEPFFSSSFGNLNNRKSQQVVFNQKA